MCDFIFQFLHYDLISFTEAHFIMLYTIAQVLMCSPVLRVTRVQAWFTFFLQHVYNGFGDHNVCFLLWPLNFFFVHSHSKMRRVWLVSQCERLKIHQYLILQQLSLIQCWSSMKHIRLRWKACRILDGTLCKCDKSNNVQHRKYLNKFLPHALAFCSFCFKRECNLFTLQKTLWCY
jgi:hypothetical protein